ncbi:hypothetical protein BQ8794_50218 [Mesorhizobium prunaredense]|uniref:Uncharacterized protein n=1 Tax=Mesorhizobium prunaredense TaxID=1631249 RepID=A0A1R3VE28_9HYPH|nr:hypothetical protein BQ8794_50218 [Mesorhizobium prunaredense]
MPVPPCLGLGAPAGVGILIEFVNHTALSLELELDALRPRWIRLTRPGGAVTGGAATLIISLHAVSE